MILHQIYNPEFMEEDGDSNTLLGGISFNFQDLNEDLTPPLNLYNGCGPKLCQGVTRRFSIPLECVGECGGMNYQFFKRITANSNEYANAWQNTENNYVFGGVIWCNISVQEMIRFHGEILQMSIKNRELGGYL